MKGSNIDLTESLFKLYSSIYIIFCLKYQA